MLMAMPINSDSRCVPQLCMLSFQSVRTKEKVGK